MAYFHIMIVDKQCRNISSFDFFIKTNVWIWKCRSRSFNDQTTDVSFEQTFTQINRLIIQAVLRYRNLNSISFFLSAKLQSRRIPAETDNQNNSSKEDLFVVFLHLLHCCHKKHSSFSLTRVIRPSSSSCRVMQSLPSAWNIQPF